MLAFSGADAGFWRLQFAFYLPRSDSSGPIEDGFP